MALNDESNNTLYFIVGGLLVVLVLIAFTIWGPITMAPEDISPAAGTSTSYESTTTTETSDVTDEDSADETRSTTERNTNRTRETD